MSEQRLEKYTFVHAIKNDCIVELAGARRAILPVFRMGTTKLQDDRSFRMEEQDFSLLKQNLANKKTPTPVLYEHGNSPRGGIAGGRIISLQEKDGEIFAHATLTKKAFDEVKEEEWLSCSGGFLASRDEEGNIRPCEMLEVSFTNLPAFPGLSDIQTFSVLKELPMPEEIKATETQVEVTADTPKEVAPVVVELEAKTETTPEPSPAPESAPEAVPAPVEVKLEAETPKVEAPAEAPVEPVKLDANPSVGELIASMQEQIDGLKALVEQLLNPEPEPDAADPGEAQEPPEMMMEAETKPEIEEFKDYSSEMRKKMADEGMAMPDGSFPIKTGKDLENAIKSYGRAKDPEAAKKHIRARAKAMGMMDKLPEGFEIDPEQVVELTTEQHEQLTEMMVASRVDEKLKAEQLHMLMETGKAEGKITPANKDAMEKLAKADLDAFKVALSTMKPILPVKRSISDAVINVDLGLLDMSPEREAEILSKAVQLKAQNPSLSLTELSAIVKKHQV